MAKKLLTKKDIKEISSKCCDIYVSGKPLKKCKRHNWRDLAYCILPGRRGFRSAALCSICGHEVKLRTLEYMQDKTVWKFKRGVK